MQGARAGPRRGASGTNEMQEINQRPEQQHTNYRQHAMRRGAPFVPRDPRSP